MYSSPRKHVLGDSVAGDHVAEVADPSCAGIDVPTLRIGCSGRHVIVPADFDAREYGAEYLSFRKGTVLREIEHPEADGNWSYASLVGWNLHGWVPTLWLDAGEVVVHDGLDGVGDSYGTYAKTDAENEIRPASRAGLMLIGQIARDQQWTYPLCDNDRGCYAGFLPRSVHDLDAAMLRCFMSQINDALEDYWCAPEGQLGRASRQSAWIVYGDCCCLFKYSKTTMRPSPWPDCMDRLMSVVMPLCGLGGIENRANWPNCCNLNRYSSTDGNDWHADDSPLFKGAEKEICIISLSLGGTRNFRLRAHVGDNAPDEIVNIELKHGDLCTMEGWTQKYYQHQVPKGSKTSEGRINLTWRWVIAHNANCPVSRCVAQA